MRIVASLLLAGLGLTAVGYGAYHAGQAHPSYAKCELMSDSKAVSFWYECPADKPR